jgi:hypothetical protein
MEVFVESNRLVTGISDHLGLSVAIRTALIVLFPLATQLILRKTDVD